MKRSLLFLVLLTLVLQSMAQDGHYWTQPYGNRSMLLNGTVVGSVSDLGAVYYNPGRLGLVDKPAFLISADVYQLTRLKVEDGFGENIDFSESDFGNGPSLVAGTFRIKIMPKFKFAYSTLTRNQSELDIFFRAETSGDVVDRIPGNEEFSGNVRINTNFKEEWMGLSIAYPLGDNLSIGISNFFSIRSQKDLFNMQLQAIGENDGRVGIFVRDREFKFNQYALVWKLGMAYNINRFSIGVTATTPKVNLSGDGTYLHQDFLAGVDTTAAGDGITDDIYESSIQKNLSSTHKLPWSIGVGVGIPIGKSMIHLTSEYFGKIDRYTIMEADPFISQSEGTTINSRVVDELEAVLNYGIGLELYLAPKLQMYYSFATDFSAVPEDLSRLLEFEEEYNNSTFQADLWHLGGGFVLNNEKVEITLGATYSFAEQQYERPLDIPDGNDPVDPDPNGLTTLNLSQWRFLFGVSFPFLKDLRKNKDKEKEESN